MRLVIGLGNPGKKYERTRHNAGFLAVDYYLKDKRPIACASKFAAEICELHFGENKGLFIKPQMFMNKSGEVLQEIVNFYKVDPIQDILVIHDEKDLPLGTIRTTDNSSSAGHNGVQNIIDHLGMQNFHRLRIGVETRPAGSPMDTEDFVLQNFTDEEWKIVHEDVLTKINPLIDKFLQS